jgi:cupin superfamily acireductone dioxygenase involved in methionine salvage
LINDYIKNLEEENYCNFPYHSNIEQLTRLVAKGIPFHVSIHQIKDIKDLPKNYVEPHKHETDELNLILADEGKELVYSVQIEDEIFEVKSPSFIWIPKDKLHSANAVRGSGIYVCIILQEKYQAYD